MKPITQLEFDAFPLDAGRRQCRSGDYSNILAFPMPCRFAASSQFADRAMFGQGCEFKHSCRFGHDSMFAARCVFGAACAFAPGAMFGPECSFGARCIFGLRMAFAPGGTFGDWCEFRGGQSNNLFNQRYTS